MKKGGAAPLSLGNTRGGSHVPVKRVGAVSRNKKKKKKRKTTNKKEVEHPEPGREKGAL